MLCETTVFYNKSNIIKCFIAFASSTYAPSTLAPRKYLSPHICPPEKNNKQRLSLNKITSKVIKSIYKDANDEM